MEGLNYHHLLYFRMVAREGSIARAAEILDVSQPTISEQIRLLEKQIAKSLFTRNGRRLMLTEAGRTALRYAEEIHALGDEMIGSLAGESVTRKNVIRLGVMQGLTSPIVSQMVSVIASANTRCLVRIADAESIAAEFKAGALDLALTETKAKGKASQTTTASIRIFGTPQMARKYKVRFPHSLTGATLLVATAFERNLEAWLASNKIPATVFAESADSSIVEALARDGQGLAVLAGRAPTGLAEVGRLEGVSLKLHLLAPAKHGAITKAVSGLLAKGLR